MTDFLRKLWELARPCRSRLTLGVSTGVLAGLMAPMIIATITVVSSMVFLPDNPARLSVATSGQMPPKRAKCSRPSVSKIWTN